MGIVEKFSTGASVRRMEDERFVTGKGQYTDDVNIEGQAHMFVVRSPFAHAYIRYIDTQSAREAEGVLGVFTAEDLRAAGALNDMPYTVVGQESATPDRSILAHDKVRFAGEPRFMRCTLDSNALPHTGHHTMNSQCVTSHV